MIVCYQQRAAMNIDVFCILCLLCWFAALPWTAYSDVICKEEKVALCSFTCASVPGYGDVKIDLSSLYKSSGPKFDDIGDSQGRSFTYQWNPCGKFTSGDCKESYACQDAGSKQYSLGRFLVVYYRTNTKEFVMHHFLGDDGRQLNVVLRYEEGEDGKVSDVREDSQNLKLYGMTLYTEHIPNDGSRGDSGGGGGISLGTILLIIFLVVLVLYFGIGITYKHKKGEQGKDKIPNREFWARMPGLIKDGCIFSARKTKECVSNAREMGIRKTAGGEEGYEEIKDSAET